MAINLKTEEGFEFSFDTVDELMEFTKRMNPEADSEETEITSDEDTSEDEIEIPETESKFEVGDKVRVVENKSCGHNVGTIGEITEVRYLPLRNRWTYEVRPISGHLIDFILSHRESDLELSEKSNNELEVGDKVRVISAEDGTSTPYHGFSIGSIVEVEEVYGDGKLEFYNGTFHQTLLPHHYEKIEPLGIDANGVDLYEGDYVTGSEDNRYANTDDTVIMEVVGARESYFFKEDNIQVKIDGDGTAYHVDSSKFIKLADNLDEAKEKFDEIKGDGRVRRGDVEEQEFKVGDKVKVTGNYAGHCLEVGEVRRITEVDSDEPKYNLSEMSEGYWADTFDIEHVDSSPKFRTGDIVRVTESFTDHFGDRAKLGAVYSYDENFRFAEPFVGTVFLGDNIDKIVLVCRDEDRLDI